MAARPYFQSRSCGMGNSAFSGPSIGTIFRYGTPQSPPCPELSNEWVPCPWLAGVYHLTPAVSDAGCDARRGQIDRRTTKATAATNASSTRPRRSQSSLSIATSFYSRAFVGTASRLVAGIVRLTCHLPPFVEPSAVTDMLGFASAASLKPPTVKNVAQSASLPECAMLC